MPSADLRCTPRCTGAGNDAGACRTDRGDEEPCGHGRSPARLDPEDHPGVAQPGQGDDRTDRDRRRGRVAGASGGAGTLPVAAEIHRRLAPHRQTNNAVDLLAVADATVVLSPGGFLGIAEEVRPGEVVVMPQLAAAQAREIRVPRCSAWMGTSLRRQPEIELPRQEIDHGYE